MNFNILNPNAFYHSQQVQKSAQTAQTESNQQQDYVEPIAAQDTVTLSQGAANGEKTKAVDNNTYEHLMAVNRIASGAIEVSNVEAVEKTTKPDALGHIDTSNFLSDAMKSMVENRLGVDKEKIEEIEAMIEEVAKDESLSAEEKEERIADLQEMLEEEYEKAAEKQAKQQQ